MERNIELIREILLFAQKDENKNKEIEIAGFSSDVIKSHVKLMHDKNLVDAIFTKSGYFINRISWDGYEFINGTKDNKSWTKIKNVFLEKGIDLSIDAVIAAIKGSNLDS